MNNIVLSANEIVDSIYADFGKIIEMKMNPELRDKIDYTKSQEKSAFSFIIKLIEHILKLNYCMSSINNNTWIKEIKNFQDEIKDLIGSNRRKKETVMINHINESLDDIYRAAVNEYNKDAAKYNDLPDIANVVPDKCPWTLVALTDLSINQLIEILDKNSKGK